MVSEWLQPLQGQTALQHEIIAVKLYSKLHCPLKKYYTRCLKWPDDSMFCEVWIKKNILRPSLITVFPDSDRHKAWTLNGLGGVPREQKMLKGHLPRDTYHQVL
jgi:hypothetical protein